MDPLVTTDWLAAHLDDPDLIVLDCTVLVDMDPETEVFSKPGRPQYDAEHIPGAGFADLFGDLSDRSSPLEFGLPSPEQFAKAMEHLGVGDDSRVVLYDANYTAWAARVWWMLRWIGFDRAAVLDGGLGAWKAAGHPVSTEPVERPQGTLTVRLRPELFADKAEVLAATEDPAITIVDTMPEEHYRGEGAMYARPGHIPSAINRPTFELFDQTGRFLSQEDLAAAVDGDPGQRHITYCGGGIAAAADALALTVLDFPNVAVYAASLEEWTTDPDLPMVTIDD